MNRLKRVEIKLIGKVQGVGMRFTIKKKADELGLFGFVSNQSDGSVFCVVEGKAEDLDNFLSFITHGIKVGSIEKIERSFSEAQGEFTDFSIIYE